MTELHTIYLIHHSHTDIGFTHDQPIVWDLHTRFIDQALHLAEKHADSDSDGAFRWTLETTGVLKRWLEFASDRDIERFQIMEKAGRLEVTGMPLNITPMFDSDQVIESLGFTERLRGEFGFDIRYAMNCDVNGVSWPLADVLLDAGIEGFTMAINTHFGGTLKPRPYPFLWQAPSGRTLPVLNGWEYSKGWDFGIGRDVESLENEWLPRIRQYLQEIAYPLPILMLQSFHPFGDNGDAFEGFTTFIDAWNAAGKTPRIIMATPRLWWGAVAEHIEKLAVWRGDWPDFWAFGCISSAREQTINRHNRTRLRNTDAIYSALPSSSAQRARRTFERYREAAWDALHLWDEHTWGADCAVANPESDDARAQWIHKAHYAFTARSLSLMLQRDAAADFAAHVARDDEAEILLFNPLPWSRVLSGRIETQIMHKRNNAGDSSAARHFQDRSFMWPSDSGIMLRPVEVQAFGYITIGRDAFYEAGEISDPVDSDMVENERYLVQFDRDTGGIASLYDKSLGREWVDTSWGKPLGSFIHEQLAASDHEWSRRTFFYQEEAKDRIERAPGWNPSWQANRSGAAAVANHAIYETPGGIEVVQELEVPAFSDPVTLRFFLPNDADHIICEASWIMGLNTQPEATYLAFPFNLPDATARYDAGGQAVIPELDHLPGCCRDYFAVQNWVDFSNTQMGVTIATPDNPLVQLGDYHFGHYQQVFSLERALLLGWVTNNYWETNFRAHQPGKVTARYHIHPYSGQFNEANAHRIGAEAAQRQMIAQRLDQPQFQPPNFPANGSLLTLPEPPIMVTHIKPGGAEDTLLLRLHNASDQVQKPRIKSDILKIEAATLCDIFGKPTADLDVHEEGVKLELPPRRLAVVRLSIRS